MECARGGEECAVKEVRKRRDVGTWQTCGLELSHAGLEKLMRC